MAIVGLDLNEENEGTVESKEYRLPVITSNDREETIVPRVNVEKTIEIVNTDKQLESIVQYISGKEWTVDYYLQLIVKDGEIGRFDPNAPDTSAQYAKIKNLVLFVESSISQDTANNISGTAYINAGVTPNQGDVFTATLMGKRRALLRVEGIEKKSYNLNNVYLLSYKVDMFIDSDTTMIRALNDKVVKDYVYDREFLNTNSTPLLLEDKYDRKRQIASDLKSITKYYLDTMFNRERSVLSIPKQDSTIVDVMLQEFIFKVIDSNDSYIISKINRISVNDETLKQPTVLDAILERDNSILDSCNKKVGLATTANFNANLNLRSIAYLGVDYIIYPRDPDLATVELSTSLSNLFDKTLKSVENKYGKNVNLTNGLIPEFDENNKYYIFTEAFYNDDAKNMTSIEGLVKMYLLNETIDTRLLTPLIAEYKYWNRVQQYFLIPILIILIRDAINRSFSVT